MGILNVLVPFPALGQRNTIYILTVRGPIPSPLNENTKDNPLPYGLTFTTPILTTNIKYHLLDSPRTTTFSYFSDKDLQYQIAPHCVAEKKKKKKESFRVGFF